MEEDFSFMLFAAAAAADVLMLMFKLSFAATERVLFIRRGLLG